MKLHEYPKVNRELKDLSLREQMEVRLRQIDVTRCYSDKAIASMSDYALLTAFEVTLMDIGYQTAEESYMDGFNDSTEIAAQKQARTTNETFPMKAGVSLVYPTESE